MLCFLFSDSLADWPVHVFFPLPPPHRSSFPSSERYIIFGDIQQSKKTLMMAVWVGMVQNVLSKATKYALFDPTKEMAYIPLDKESKVPTNVQMSPLHA